MDKSMDQCLIAIIYLLTLEYTASSKSVEPQKCICKNPKKPQFLKIIALFHTKFCQSKNGKTSRSLIMADQLSKCIILPCNFG